MADGAVAVLRQVDSDDEPRIALLLGQALASYGYALADGFGRYPEGIEAFGEAILLSGAAKDPANQRLHTAGALNLAYVIAVSRSFDGHSRALGYLTKARAYLKGQRRNAARYRLLWVEALIWSKAGSHAKAETLFLLALEGFTALKMPYEIALVALDLGAVHALLGYPRHGTQHLPNTRPLPGISVGTVQTLECTEPEVGSGPPLCIDNWGLDRIGEESQPSDFRYQWPANGGGRRIYSFDTGVRDSHDEFDGAVSSRVTHLFNATGEADGDVHGHGTHVAGIAAGRTYGVAKWASIYAVKVVDDSQTTNLSWMLGPRQEIMIQLTWLHGVNQPRRGGSV